jgi:hypothetical protein
MTDSSTFQSNPNFLPEAESSDAPLGLHNPLLTPDALGQGKFSAGLIPLGSRRITVLDPSFFQRKPLLQEGSELHDPDLFSIDTVKSRNDPESLISSSSSKIQRSSLPKSQSQESLSLISNSDQNSLLSKPSIDSSNLISDSTSLSNIDSSEFQSLLSANNLQLKREEKSSQISHTSQRQSDFSPPSFKNVLDTTSLDHNLSHFVKPTEIKPDLKISDQPVQRSSIGGVSDPTQNTIKSESINLSISQSNKSDTEFYRDIENMRSSFSASIEEDSSLPSPSITDLQLKIEVEESAKTPISIEPTNQTTEHQIQRLSATEDLNVFKSQVDTFQLEQQLASSTIGLDEQVTLIQRSNSFESTNQGSSIGPPSNIDIQSKLESESFDQASRLIQRYQEVSPPSQPNSGEAIGPANQTTEQQIQRSLVTEESNIIQRQIDSFQPERQSVNSVVGIDRQSAPIQRTTSSESISQGSPTQSLSNVDIQFRQEAKEPNFIQKHPKTDIYSQPDSGEAISIESVNQSTKQQVQRFSAIEDSTSVQMQSDSSQLENKLLNSPVELDQQFTLIQRSTSSESTNQDLLIRLPSNIDAQSKLESQELNQISNLIQENQETNTSSQPDSNIVIAIEPIYNTSSQEIRRFSIIEDSSPTRSEIDSSQLEHSSVNSAMEIDGEFTQIQRSTSSESKNQDLLIQSASTVDTQFKQESEEPNFIQRHQGVNTYSQPDSGEAITTEELPNQSVEQEIQRLSVIEDSPSIQRQIYSSQIENKSLNPAVRVDQQFTLIQRSNSFESTKQDLSIQLPSNIDIQSKLESESFDQNSSLIQRYQEVPPSSQLNSGEAIAIELAKQNSEQQIQRLSVPEDSNIVQRQIDSFQPKLQSVRPSTETDRQSTPIQRATSSESIDQDSPTQSSSNVDIQLRQESEEPNLIQKHPEIDVYSQPGSGEAIAIEPTNQTTEQQIQRFSVAEDSEDPNVIQRQIDSFQPKLQSVNSAVGIDRESTQIQRLISSKSTNQDLSIQSSSNVDRQFKLESQELNQISSLIQRQQEADASSQPNLIEPIHNTSTQEIQRFSVIEDSNSSQVQIDPSQREQQPVNSVVESDREPTQIQRSTITPYLIQDLEQSITKLEDAGSASIDAIGPEEEMLGQIIQRSPTIEGSDMGQTKINLSQSIDQEANSWIKNDRHSIENQPLNSLPSEDKALYSQLSTSTDLQFKLEHDASNLLPNLIRKSQESPSSSPTYSNVSSAADLLEISNDRIDVISPKSENHISDQPIQRSSAIEVPDQMPIGSSQLDIQSTSLIDKPSPSINKSLSSNIIKRTQEPSSYKAQSIDSDFPIEKSFSKSPNEPTSSINISIHDDIIIDRDYIQRSSLSESQSEQPESSAISQQPKIEKLPNVLKEISILKPLIQPDLQRSILDISNTPRKLDPEPLNVWSTILHPRSQSHSPSLKTDRINFSSHSESSDNYHDPSSPYNLNAKSDISVVMNSPQEWLSLESLVQMKSEPQKETLQRKSSESYPQIISSQSSSNRNISNQSNIARQEIFIQRNTSPFSLSVESDQKYVEINSDRDPKFDREKITKSEHFEALAQEIYLLLRQRLVIDQERQGSGYSGRLPW